MNLIMDLNKGISTPIAILLIIAISAVVGVLIWQFTKPAEEPTPKQASDYTTQSACESAGYYWYEGSCYKEGRETKAELPVPQAPSLIFLEGAKPSIQITWNRQIADYFNIYRATSLEGPWTKIIEKHPKNAGSAVDYDYPKNTEVLYYKITSVNEDGVESEFSEINSVELTENKTTDWKAYTSEEYGFEFKYPENWRGISTSSEQMGTNFLFLLTRDRRKPVEKSLQFSLSIYEDKNMAQSEALKKEPIETERKDIASESTEIFTYSDDFQGPHDTTFKMSGQYTWLEKDNLHFLLDGAVAGDMDDWLEKKELFSKMLSTFKFTK